MSVERLLDRVSQTLIIRISRYPEAHNAADRALAADPTSVKARYRRGMVRKHMKMWTAAGIGTFFSLYDSITGAHPNMRQIFACCSLSIPGIRTQKANWRSWKKNVATLCIGKKKKRTWAAIRTTKRLRWKILQNSENHSRNRVIATIQAVVSLASFITVPNAIMGVPVGSRMRQTRRANGMHCEHDSFRRCVVIVTKCVFRGRNVCRYYLIGVCKFGERCSYLHSKEYLSQQGWWSTADGIDKEKWRYNLIQMCNKTITDDKHQAEAAGTGQRSKKKKPKRKGDPRARPGLWGSDAGVTSTKNHFPRAPSPR